MESVESETRRLQRLVRTEVRLVETERIELSTPPLQIRTTLFKGVRLDL
jgi:hypothetical protein